MIIWTHNAIKTNIKINCMSNTQPMQNTRNICIKDTRSNKSTSVYKIVVLKII